MIKKSSLLLGMFFLVGIGVQGSAQTVPVSVKREISNQLSCGGTQYDDITVVRLGPGKRGYIGQCALGGNAFIWEKTARGINRIFTGETQMNGGISIGKPVYKGYYEVISNAHGSWYSYDTTYRWNGSRFVVYKNKSRECDVTSNGLLRNCKTKIS